MNPELLKFVGRDDVRIENFPWCKCEWLCKPGIVPSEHILLVRAIMPGGECHKFHRHPSMEEIIFVLEGRAEQWVEKESRILGPGEVAHIPTNTVHGTYNPFPETLVFLAILSPAHAPGPSTIDVFAEEPWRSLKPAD